MNRTDNKSIVVDKVSRWYGQVIGVNEVSFEVGTGVTALLGPNGAGKSTLMKLITGQILPNQGEVKVAGVHPFHEPRFKQDLGYLPEIDALYDQLSGEKFLYHRALLRGYAKKEARQVARKAFVDSGLEIAGDKKTGAYSKGMRQRLKLAQALLHDPRIVVLDEPLTGLDPVGRHQVIDQIKQLGEAGCTVLVSSHVLHEVELMTDQVILIVRGKILAEGTIEHIRSLIDTHPHTVDIKADQLRDLAVALFKADCVVSASLQEEDRVLRIKTRVPDKFYDTLGKLVLDQALKIERFHSPDNNLQAVFDYLVK